MIYKKFKDIQLSRLGMGNMRLPVCKEIEGKPIDEAKACEIIDYAMAHGINYYDTAYVYHGGESEKFLARALVAKYPRDQFYLATKFLFSANPNYEEVFNEQLQRLNTSYIDFYLLHAIGDNSYEQYLNSGCLAYFIEMQRQGKIKYLGFSSHASPQVLAKMIEQHNWDFAQIQLNYFDWNYDTTKEEYALLQAHQIPIMVMEPVRGGRLAELSSAAEALLKERHSDWSMAKWAFQFTKSLPQVQVTLSGMSTLAQITDNVATFEKADELNDDEMALLFKACDIFKRELQVPCTACRYCTPDCPAHIEIPVILKIYNDYKINGRWALNQLQNCESKGKPDDCLNCGSCSAHCPQNINIPEIMQNLKSH